MLVRIGVRLPGGELAGEEEVQHLPAVARRHRTGRRDAPRRRPGSPSPRPAPAAPPPPAPRPGSGCPRGSPRAPCPTACRHWRTRTTRPSPSMATIATAPGCSTISRPARLPSTVSTVSSWTVSRRPWNTVRRSTGCSRSCSSAMLRSLTEPSAHGRRRGGGTGGHEPPASARFREPAVVGCAGHGSPRSRPLRRASLRRSAAHPPASVEREDPSAPRFAVVQQRIDAGTVGAVRRDHLCATCEPPCDL